MFAHKSLGFHRKGRAADIVTGKITADEVVTPLIGTETAVDVILQRNSVEILRLAAAGPEIRAAAPLLAFRETDQGADGKIYWFLVSGGEFRIDAINDAETLATRGITINRTGMTINYVEMPNGRTRAPGFDASSAGDATTPAFRLGTTGSNGVFLGAANRPAISAGGGEKQRWDTFQVGMLDHLVLSSGVNFNSNGTIYHTPRVVDVDAAADIIAPGGSNLVRVTLSAGAIVSTAAPFIADGSDGQIITLVRHTDAGTLTLNDETVTAGSNLRLSAAAVLGPRDSLILRFVSAIGDWVEVGRVNAL